MALTIKSIKSLLPLADRVLVQRIKAAEKTASGIFLPTSNQEKVPEASVLAVGPGARDEKGQLIAPEVAVGDRVMLPPFGGQTFKLGDDDYLILRSSEIVAKINE